MKNSLKNMVLVLGGITLVASAAVGLVYTVTKEPIESAKEANKVAALSQVLPAFEESSAENMELDGIPVVVYTAHAGGKIVGYAVESATRQGFSGEFKIMAGFTPEGEVYGIKILEHNETPGLGSKMEGEDNPLIRSVKGKNPSKMNLAVSKDGGEVDALTAATITSRAWVDALKRAFNALCRAQGMDTDAVSGATSTTQSADAQSSATTQTATGAESATDNGKEDNHE